MLARCRSIEDVDKTVTEIQDRMRDADEIAEAISSTNYSGVEIDPVSTYISSHFHNSSHLMYYRTNSRTSSRSWSSRSSTMFSQKPTIPQYTSPQLRRLHHQRVRVSLFFHHSTIYSFVEQAVAELDEEAELRKLQAELAM